MIYNRYAHSNWSHFLICFQDAKIIHSIISYIQNTAALKRHPQIKTIFSSYL